MTAAPPLIELDVPKIAKALARGESADVLLPTVPAALRDTIASVARACGQTIIDLEEREKRLQSTLVDLRMALRGYSAQRRKLREENEELRAAIEPGRQPIIGSDGGLAEVMRLVERVIDAPIPLLITGESGTGKEVIARYVHRNGPRSEGPFIAINCAALPEPLLESELFGIEKGTATGVEQRSGKFEEASGGTLFLDEVADMTLAVQAKILRAIQEQEIVRVGGRKSIKIDVRLVSATNKNLETEIAARRFREDLYYRIVGVHVHLPPLRERKADVDKLLEHFLEATARRFNRQARRFSAAALDALRGYAWPGNVRELIVEVERAVALADGEQVEVENLTPRVAATLAAARNAGTVAIAAGEVPKLKDARRHFERSLIETALARANGSRRRAAKLLGLSREGFRKKLQMLGFPAGDAPDSRDPD